MAILPNISENNIINGSFLLGADSLEYLSVEGLVRAVKKEIQSGNKEDGHCTACLTGEYPGGVPDELEWWWVWVKLVVEVFISITRRYKKIVIYLWFNDKSITKYCKEKDLHSITRVLRSIFHVFVSLPKRSVNFSFQYFFF